MAAKKAAAKPAKKAAKPAAKAPKAAKSVPTTKADILKVVAGAAGITNAQAAALYGALLDIVVAGAKSGSFVVPGLGKVSKVKKAARTGFNPRTKAKIKIAARTVLKFKVAKALSDAVL